ncbi:hypothetical protein D3C85_755640 [compost metagenome]
MRKQSKGSKIRQSKAFYKSASSWAGLKKILDLLERTQVNNVSTPVNSDAALEILGIKHEL